MRTYKKKVQDTAQTTARATHVMLARASTTSLACAQAPKTLSDAQVDSNSGGGPKEDCQRVTPYHIPLGPMEKYFFHQK